jgi:hypothetical protein
MQFLTAAGVPLVSGKLYTYLAGTTTPATTYTSSSGGAANTNPIILNSRGEADVWLAPGVQYKFILKDASTPTPSTIWTVDNITAVDASGAANWLTSVSGTNTIAATAAGAPITAYAAGQVFRFTAANTITGPATLNINTLGAKAITRMGTTALAAGDIRSGEACEVVYDGTQFQLINHPGSVVVDASGNVSATSFQSTSGYNGPSVRFKNRVINGGMYIDQRNAGASQNIASALTPGNALVYTLDRFYVSAIASTGTPTISVQRTTVGGSGAVRNRMRITGNTNITSIVVGTRLEAVDTYDLAGQNVVISVELASSTLSSIGWALYYATSIDTFGTIAAPTRTLISSGTFSTVTATPTTFNTGAVAVPSAANTGLELVLTAGALAAAATWDISNVQLEEGSTATPFEIPPFALEVARCQRYFCKTFDLETKPAQNTAAQGTIGLYTQAANVTFGYGWRFPVPMRTTPTTFTYYNPSAANAQWSAGGVAVATVDEATMGVTLAGATPTIGAGVRTSIHATASAEL